MSENPSKFTPLSELEMVELLQLCYPDDFPDDDDGAFEGALDFVEELGGFNDMADLLGRVIMLTAPMESGMTKSLDHCLGEVTLRRGEDQLQVHMSAVVTRNATQSVLLETDDE